MTNLEREFTRQYARSWYLIRKHANELNGAGLDLLLDITNLRQRDIASIHRKGEHMRGR